VDGGEEVTEGGKVQETFDYKTYNTVKLGGGRCIEKGRARQHIGMKEKKRSVRSLTTWSSSTTNTGGAGVIGRL